MKPMLHQRHAVHHGHKDNGENDPVIERRAEEKGRQQNHRGQPGHELHKAFHPGTIPQPHGIR